MFVALKFKNSNFKQKLASDLIELSVIFLHPLMSKYFILGLYVAISSMHASLNCIHSPNAKLSIRLQRRTIVDTQLFLIF